MEQLENSKNETKETETKKNRQRQNEEKHPKQHVNIISFQYFNKDNRLFFKVYK